MEATIVIPTYNEALNIEKLLLAIGASVPQVKVLVVDDNSPDGTANIVNRLALKNKNIGLLLRDKKEGIGAAYIAGFKHVFSNNTADLVIMMDADLSHDPKYLPTMLGLAKDHDVVLGSRYVRGGGTVGWEWWRKAMSYWGNLYAHIVAGLPMLDCTGGFNAIRTSRLRELDFESMNVTGYAFIMGLKFMLVGTGASFVEFPIIFQNRREGESKMSGASIVRYFNEGILAPWKMRFKS